MLISNPLKQRSLKCQLFSSDFFYFITINFMSFSKTKKCVISMHYIYALYLCQNRKKYCWQGKNNVFYYSTLKKMVEEMYFTL